MDDVEHFLRNMISPVSLTDFIVYSGSRELILGQQTYGFLSELHKFILSSSFFHVCCIIW